MDQREALWEFYIGTNGPNWRNNTNWGVTNDICSWFGVGCTGQNVSLLALPFNNLTGSFPSSIINLPSLRYLDISHNRLFSGLPTSISCLSNILYVDLSANIGLNGTLPSSIGELIRLQYLDISFNQFNGIIPDSISSCSSLRVLSAQYNKLSGTIPQSFYSLKSLMTLDLSNNGISGVISDSFGQLNNLEVFLLAKNNLEGTIPASIGNLTELIEFNIGYNQISGSIPKELCESVRIEKLILGGNFLQGAVPDCFCQLIYLTQLDLSRNQLSGTISAMSLVKLQLLDLSTNGFSGTLPNMTSLSSIQFIDVSANQFSGTLPDYLMNKRLSFMRSFDASSNLLSGALPTWIQNVTDVSLFLTNNKFICPYPSPIPLNVHVDSHCASGLWYQGLFVVVVTVMEVFGFILTAIGLTVTITYLYRPSLLDQFGRSHSRRHLNKEHLQTRADCLTRTRNFLIGACVLEAQVSLLMVLVGVVLFISNHEGQLYPEWMLISVPLTGLCFFLKCGIAMWAALRRVQSGLLALSASQLLQIIFVFWALALENVAEANALSLCVIVTIVLDNQMNVLASLEAYYIQDQFIPIHQLKLDELLKDGEGAFGEVRHGTYLGLDVAAKRAKPKNSKDRKEIFKAFLNEAKILSELGHHSNIVKLIGISPMFEDEFYIVMEYCEGGTALSYLRKIRLEQNLSTHLKAVVKICMGVCDAMHYLHSKGYTHRDITACNIMIKRGRAMLGDMGLASKIRRTRDAPRRTSSIPRFNYLYSAPELRAAHSRYTKECDVYCFGIALWEMVLLRKWTEFDVQRGAGECLRELNEIHVIFGKIVSRCWHEDPAFRPTFEELLEEMSRLNQQEWSTYRMDSSTEPRGFFDETFLSEDSAGDTCSTASK